MSYVKNLGDDSLYLEGTPKRPDLMEPPKPEKESQRRIIQIAPMTTAEDPARGNEWGIYALCNDGTVWLHIVGPSPFSNPWGQLPPIPQDEEE